LSDRQTENKPQYWRTPKGVLADVSAPTNFHDPRTTPFGRKVIRRREKERGKKEEKKKKKLVATTFATQSVFNAAWAAHALRSDQYNL
jgi:hypothetical protein